MKVKTLTIICVLLLSFTAYAGGGGGGGGGGSSSAVPILDTGLLVVLVAIFLYCFRKEK